jgi:RimJ/RimL family protein N-acetyltransferase
MTLPVLRTKRLVLRPFTVEDAPRVRELAGAREIALNTLNIPHPYPEGAAEEWIRAHEQKIAEGMLSFAIDDGALVGAIGLTVKRCDDAAEIGYWVGVPFWGRGYTTEAAAEVIRYAFEDLQLNKVYAAHFTRNPSSGRVMQKLGMRYEGTLRQQHKKWGEYVDVDFYGILRGEFVGQSGS